MNKLSVVIITFNEEANIARCIDSVAGIADEVVVVDSFSTDRTKEIAEAKGVRFITHAFEGHIQQKNWAKEQATYDMVLSLDADEALSEELKQAVSRAKNETGTDGYTMNRLNFYCGRPVKIMGWYPDTKLRLWNRKKGNWTGVNPHDKFEMIPGAIIKHLAGDILHNTYPTHQQYLLQKEKFATISAQHLQGENILYLVVKMLFSPAFKFIKNYFFQAGFTWGYTGLVLAYYQSREVFLKYYRAIRLK